MNVLVQYMPGEGKADTIDEDIATAFGIFALTDSRIHEAAKAAGISRWKLEDAIEDAGLADTFDLNAESDVSETIDDLLDG